jgi:hypothetical protein
MDSSSTHVLTSGDGVGLTVSFNVPCMLFCDSHDAGNGGSGFSLADSGVLDVRLYDCRLSLRLSVGDQCDLLTPILESTK